MIEIRELNRNQMKKEEPRGNGFHAGAVCVINEDGNYTVKLHYDSNTKERLHELAHVYLNHLSLTEPDSYRKIFKRECEAEIFAYEKMGKKINPNICLAAIRDMAMAGWHGTNILLYICIDFLRTLKYEINNKTRNQLRRNIKAICESKACWDFNYN
jgi:hypothetical protein